MAVASCAAVACPNCGVGALNQNDPTGDRAQGFTISMIGMAGTPFLLLALGGAAVARVMRRQADADSGVPVAANKD